MAENVNDDRLARLQAAAEAEQRLIVAEREAERALKRAQDRLAKIEAEFLELEREVKERRDAVKQARAFLTAVQRQRQSGPS
ncbi:MAG: hypothetical protein IT334_11450 [Thermomicrobiales bacterium]|nr:hypothetical protein [Thermomicrobiales bacterium]